MKVTAQNHDEVSALLTVTVDQADFRDKVEKQLHNYAKNAQVPGFRKGKVPMSMVKRQYEAPIAFEEVNKVVSDALNNYVTENNLKLVGQPVPVPTDSFDLNAPQVTVSFEIGFEPEMTIDLAKYEAPHYKVEASEKEISKSIENMQRRFASQEPQENIGEDTYVQVEVKQVMEEGAEGHNHPPKMSSLTKDTAEAFALVKGLKMDGSVKITKEELQKNEELARQLGFSKQEVENMHHNEVELTVKDFYGLKDHKLNQELFDKVYGEGTIKSEEELKEKVKSELDEYFQQNADIYFVNKILEDITEKEEVKLPETFLIKWLQFSNENVRTDEQAKEILEKERNIIKHQIIEGKLLNDNEIKIDYADVLGQSEQLVRNQLAMYGIHHLPDEEVQKYAAEMLKDQNQLQQISQEVAMAKLKDVILEKSKKVETPISHDDFMEVIKEQK